VADPGHVMVSTVERRSWCNPVGYLFVSTLRPKVLWRRLLGYGAHFPAEESVPPSRPPSGTMPGGSEQARPVVTPLRILRSRCFLLRSPY
jgi:hypothetical protein